jgi:hypothetical protein
MPPDLVLKAHGTSPAMGRKGCALACGTFVQLQQKAEPDSRGFAPAVHDLVWPHCGGREDVDTRAKPAQGVSKL